LPFNCAFEFVFIIALYSPVFICPIVIKLINKLNLYDESRQRRERQVYDQITRATDDKLFARKKRDAVHISISVHLIHLTAAAADGGDVPLE
jgi:hypothetical protein